jgi:hypothetical protein
LSAVQVGEPLELEELMLELEETAEPLDELDEDGPLPDELEDVEAPLVELDEDEALLPALEVAEVEEEAFDVLLMGVLLEAPVAALLAEVTELEELVVAGEEAPLDDELVVALVEVLPEAEVLAFSE